MAKLTDGAPRTDVQSPLPGTPARDRGSLFRLLGHLYRRELTREFIAELERSGFPEQMEAMGYPSGLPPAEDVTDEFIKQGRRDYTRLFIGPGWHVSPYGSVHHPDDPKRGRLWGDTTKTVKRFVEHHGLGFKKGYGGIPDHVGVEFEFFSHLLEREASHRDEGNTEKADRMVEIQRIFFNEHIGAWIPEFCEKAIETAGDMAFYSSFVRMTRDFVASEVEHYPPRSEDEARVKKRKKKRLPRAP